MNGVITQYVGQNPKKSSFFRYFLSLNEVKEPPWKQIFDVNGNFISLK